MLKPGIVWATLLAIVPGSTGCDKSDGSNQSFSEVGARPDVLPVMLNRDLPFRYPPSLYAKKVQANVTLRVFIDKEGQVVAESTHVAESSSIPSLDSAAVRGSGELRFIPAKTRGNAVPVSILFPVYFRHPDALPLPGDTILRKTGASAMPASPRDTSRVKDSVVKPKPTSTLTANKSKTSKKPPARKKR